MRFTNRGTLLFLLLCLVVIGGALVFLSSPASAPNGGTTTPNPAVRLFPDLAVTDIVEIKVTDTTASAETVFRQQEDGAWTVASTSTELTGDVTQNALDEAASTLANLAAENFASTDLAKFGLATPGFSVSFTTQAGTSQTLAFGSRNPAGTAYYALLNADQVTVYIVTNASRLTTLTGYAAQPPFQPTPSPTPEPVLSLPGALFTGFDPMGVNRLELRANATDEVLIMTRDGTSWSVEEATNSQPLPLEPQLVNVVLMGFGFLQGATTLEAEDLAPLGLDAPRYTLAAFTETTRYTLNLGALDVSGQFYYGLVNDIPTVALIPKNDVNTLLGLIDNPPYVQPETTAEATAETTAEATAAP